MNDQDREAIDQLFEKLREVEGRVGPRDREAEALIREKIATQPSAPYYLAQTVVVQQQALEAARQRIEELESRTADRGFFGGLFGGSERTEARRAAPARDDRPQPWGQQGFLAGAAQTAMGVAGGVLLGNLIAGSLFGGPGAYAADAADADASGDDADMSEVSDSGGGDFDGGGFDGGGD